MPFPILSLLVSLLFVNGINCVHRSSHKRTSKPFTPPSPVDEQSVAEALKILNFGKETLGLNTEDPLSLMELVNNPDLKVKSEQAQKLALNPQNFPKLPVGRQYLTLSGKDGKMILENFTKVTPDPSTVAGNANNVQDVFKMTMEKMTPTSKAKEFRKITIIESNDLKPSSHKELSHPSHFRHKRKKKKHKKIRSHDREKRARFTPLLSLLNGEYSPRIHEHKDSDKTNAGDNETHRLGEEGFGGGFLVTKLFGKISTTRKTFGVESIRRNIPEVLDIHLPNIPTSSRVHSDVGKISSQSKLEERVTESSRKTIATGSIFDEEIFEKFIDSIGLGSSTRRTSRKVVSSSDVSAHLKEESTSLASLKVLPKTIEPHVTSVNKKGDLFPPLGVERYALVERVLPLERERDPFMSNVFGVAGIMSMALMCFITILIVYR
ncbi:uncharacterized protein NPIL_471941 [Nephila pilipes]|uniref:Uncharacterized protein n=1 Tax=Nephila pilipes TaxID=299642 RepID=A0A8X6N487_NEPPI|nr:uncharacterized protein NPIL_471941 [Nephila pilipes]